MQYYEHQKNKKKEKQKKAKKEYFNYRGIREKKKPENVDSFCDPKQRLSRSPQIIIQLFHGGVRFLRRGAACELIAESKRKLQFRFRGLEGFWRQCLDEWRREMGYLISRAMNNGFLPKEWAIVAEQSLRGCDDGVHLSFPLSQLAWPSSHREILVEWIWRDSGLSVILAFLERSNQSFRTL